MASAPNLQFKFVNYTGLEDGPSVIIMGATHGNEICGTEAIRRVMAELDSWPDPYEGAARSHAFLKRHFA